VRAIATGGQSGCLAGLLGAVASACKQDSGSENDKNKKPNHKISKTKS